MSTPVIGIDLGTTNSVVSYTDGAGITHVIADESGDRVIPSVVQFGGDGSLVVGKTAKAYAKVEPDRVASVFKRGMGDRTFLPDEKEFVIDGSVQTPEQLSAIVLRKLADIASREFGAPAGRAVITVPHYFGEPERAATGSSGEIAGLEVLQIINEPRRRRSHAVPTAMAPRRDACSSLTSAAARSTSRSWSTARVAR
jgi:molecular chaperone DnaK